MASQTNRNQLLARLYAADRVVEAANATSPDKAAAQQFSNAASPLVDPTTRPQPSDDAVARQIAAYVALLSKLSSGMQALAEAERASEERRVEGSSSPAAPSLDKQTNGNTTKRKDTDVSPNKVTPAGYICYVNGLRVPIHSATVSYGVGKVPTARVQFFPSKHLHKFGSDDRVEIVLFYLDTYVTEQPKYRLLFEGEIVSWNYSAGADSGSISVDAVADIAILSQINYGVLDDVRSLTLDATSKADLGANTAGLYTKQALLTRGLIPDSNSAGVSQADKRKSPSIQRPFDILQNALMAMAGSTNIEGKRIPYERRIAAVNFFSRWARKRNFIDRFVAVPDFDTKPPSNKKSTIFPLLQGFEYANILDAIQRMIESDWKNNNLFKVISDIFDSVFYELQMLPTATAVLSGIVDCDIKAQTTNAAQNEGGKGGQSRLRLTNYYAKPKMFFAIPPMCNVVFPSMVRSFTYTEQYMLQPTRVYVEPEVIPQLFNLDRGTALGFTQKRVMSVAYPPEANAVLDAMLKRGDYKGSGPSAYQVAKNTLVWGRNGEEFYKGPLSVEGAASTTYSMYQMLLKASNAKATDETVGEALLAYVENEYYLRRYNKRSGQVDMVFNPYVVPGYPTVIFDRKEGFHVVGYAYEVVHSLTHNSMSTSMSYTGGRTVNEWLQLIGEDTEYLGTKLYSAPADPILQVMEVTQVLRSAEKHYKTLFYSDIHATESKSNGTVTRNKAAFNVLEVLALESSGGHRPLEHAVDKEADSPKAVKRRASRHAAEISQQLKFTEVTEDSVLVPTDAYAQYFENTTLALGAVARPICTLQEYVCFRNGLGAISDEAVDTWVEAPRENVYGDRAKTRWKIDARVNKGAVATIYDRVYEMSAETLTDQQKEKIAPFSRKKKRAKETAAAVLVETEPEHIAVLPSNKHHNRKNWTDALTKYKAEVEGVWPKEP